MERKVLGTLKACQKFLEANEHLANGKNFQVNFLYATSANSRWAYENLWGVYLAKPQFAWMALWMAITSRSRLQKRQARYFYPRTMDNDFIGRVEIYNPQNLSRQDILQDKAYLYLFDPVSFQNLPRLDISSEIKSVKKAALARNGFEQKTIRRRGKTYNTLVRSLEIPLLVDIDEWQLAILGIGEIVPIAEIVLDKELIQQLAARIKWADKEIGENYIVNL